MGPEEVDGGGDADADEGGGEAGVQRAPALMLTHVCDAVPRAAVDRRLRGDALSGGGGGRGGGERGEGMRVGKGVGVSAALFDLDLEAGADVLEGVQESHGDNTAHGSGESVAEGLHGRSAGEGEGGAGGGEERGGVMRQRSVGSVVTRQQEAQGDKGWWMVEVVEVRAEQWTWRALLSSPSPTLCCQRARLCTASPRQANVTSATPSCPPRTSR